MLFGSSTSPLGRAPIIIGHVVFNSAYATVIIQARMATMTASLEEAAADLGARRGASSGASPAAADAGDDRGGAARVHVLVR